VGRKLARIIESAVLVDLGEALLDCADGEAWLARLEATRHCEYRTGVMSHCVKNEREASLMTKVAMLQPIALPRSRWNWSRESS
jgi:hypothetical protein